MRLVHVLVLTGLAGCLSPSSPPAGASETASPEVRKATALVRKTAPTGKAHVTELAHGQSAWLGTLELAPGLVVPEHRDPTEEIIHVLEGTGTITIEGQAYEVGPGDTITMPANALVTYSNGPTAFKGVQVFAGPGPASKYEAWAVAPE